MIARTPEGHTFRTDVSDSVNGEPSDARPLPMPLNRWQVRVWGNETHRMAPAFTTVLGPASLDEAMAAFDTLVSRRGLTGVHGQIMPSYTADGCYVWSGKPLTPGTVGYGEWEKCRQGA